MFSTLSTCDDNPVFVVPVVIIFVVVTTGYPNRGYCNGCLATSRFPGEEWTGPYVAKHVTVLTLGHEYVNPVSAKGYHDDARETLHTHMRRIHGLCWYRGSRVGRRSQSSQGPRCPARDHTREKSVDGTIRAIPRGGGFTADLFVRRLDLGGDGGEDSPRKFRNIRASVLLYFQDDELEPQPHLCSSDRRAYDCVCGGKRGFGEG